MKLVHVQAKHVGEDLHCEHEHAFEGTLPILGLTQLLKEILIVVLSLVGLFRYFLDHELDFLHSIVEASTFRGKGRGKACH